MRMHPSLFSLFVSIGALSGGRAQAQGTVLFHGTAGSFGTLEQRDLASGASVPLPLRAAPVRLLPLEVNGRTELTRADAGRPWRYDDVPGASRIALPAEAGSLFFYETIAGPTARRFGIFWIDPGGTLRRAVELPGTGAAGDQNPLLARVATASDGRALLCATTLAGGGNLLEVDLPSGLVTDRTAALAPLDWRAQSLFLAPQWGVAMHASGLVSFARPGPAQAVEFNFGINPPLWFSGELALSELGNYAVFVAGASPQAADVYVASPQGALVRATPQAAAISPAGYLPEQLDGPFLAVADDGSRCSWRTEGLTREAFLARVPWQSAIFATQLTSNADFTDTIDEVGQFAFRVGAAFVFTAGERDTLQGGIDKIDVFSAALPVGGPAVQLQNLTQSSGIALPPFTSPGTIKPEGAVDLPGTLGRMLLDRNLDRIVVYAPQGGPAATLLNNVKDFDGVARSGNRWILLVRRTTSGQPREVIAWNSATPLSAQLVYSNGNADSYDQISLRGNTVAFISRDSGGDELRGCDLSTGNLFLFPVKTFPYGPAIALTAQGELTTSLGGPLAPAIFVKWRFGQRPLRVGPITGPGFVLRGL
ncbi:MAG TPA: hypothetical protein VK843_22815 [Planctomycetota bacterium]|nr:hypothetical protein [Planctomycetota bacterium]